MNPSVIKGAYEKPEMEIIIIPLESSVLKASARIGVGDDDTDDFN